MPPHPTISSLHCFHSPQFGRRFQRRPQPSRGQMLLGQKHGSTSASSSVDDREKQMPINKVNNPSASKSPPVMMRRLSRKCQHWLTGGNNSSRSSRCFPHSGYFLITLKNSIFHSLLIIFFKENQFFLHFFLKLEFFQYH